MERQVNWGLAINRLDHETCWNRLLVDGNCHWHWTIHSGHPAWYSDGYRSPLRLIDDVIGENSLLKCKLIDLPSRWLVTSSFRIISSARKRSINSPLGSGPISGEPFNFWRNKSCRICSSWLSTGTAIWRRFIWKFYRFKLLIDWLPCST